VARGCATRGVVGDSCPEVGLVQLARMFLPELGVFIEILVGAVGVREG
jgi:hypothetical protein